MVLKNNIEAYEYFISTMIKNETLEKIQTGQLDSDIEPTLKWLRAKSGWELRYVWSGQLQTTLLSKGFVFISFIKEATNNKKDIVIWGQGRKMIEALKYNQSNGQFYLKEVSTANFKNTKGLNLFTTSSLDVFLSFALLPETPQEIKNLANIYIKSQSEFVVNDLDISKAKIEVSKFIKNLEKRLSINLAKSFKDLAYSAINNALPKELTEDGLTAIKTVIEKKVKGLLPEEILSLEIVNKIQTSRKLFTNILQLIFAPEVIVGKVVTKGSLAVSKKIEKGIINASKKNISKKYIKQINKGKSSYNKAREIQNESLRLQNKIKQY